VPRFQQKTLHVTNTTSCLSKEDAIDHGHCEGYEPKALNAQIRSTPYMYLPLCRTGSQPNARTDWEQLCLLRVTIATHSTNNTLAKHWCAVSLLYRNVFKIHTFYEMVQLLTVFILPMDAAVNRLPSLQKLAPLSRASFSISLRTQITSGRQNENSASSIK